MPRYAMLVDDRELLFLSVGAMEAAFSHHQEHQRKVRDVLGLHRQHFWLFERLPGGGWLLV